MDTGYPAKPAEKQISFQSDISISEHLVDIKEIGLFNSSSGATMLCRQVINTIEHDSSFSLKILITLTLSGA